MPVRLSSVFCRRDGNFKIPKSVTKVIDRGLESIPRDTMEIFAVDGFHETKMALALFKGVKNAAHLKSTYLNRVALIDAGESGQMDFHTNTGHARSNSFEMSLSIPRVSLMFDVVNGLNILLIPSFQTSLFL